MEQAMPRQESDASLVVSQSLLDQIKFVERSVTKLQQINNFSLWNNLVIHRKLVTE